MSGSLSRHADWVIRPLTLATAVTQYRPCIRARMCTFSRCERCYQNNNLATLGSRLSLHIDETDPLGEAVRLPEQWNVDSKQYT